MKTTPDSIEGFHTAPQNVGDRGKSILPRGTIAGVAVAIALMAMIDIPVTSWVNQHQPFPPVIKETLKIVRLPGHIGFTAALAALMIWGLRRHWREAVALLAAGVAASTVTAILKYCLGRVRPFHGRAAFDWNPFPGSPLQASSFVNLSFPSGDATLAFATATVIASVFPRARGVAFAWAVLVAATRVLQGAHYPSDVTAGAFVGMVFAQLICHAFGVPTENLTRVSPD